jgi:hypothetical protein
MLWRTLLQVLLSMLGVLLLLLLLLLIVVLLPMLWLSLLLQLMPRGRALLLLSLPCAVKMRAILFLRC